MTNGLVVMTPSSIAYSGTSASINANGSVAFSACTSLSLNGVFTSDYDNYMIVNHRNASGNMQVRMRLRSSGTDNATVGAYTHQLLDASSTTVSAGRFVSDFGDNFQFGSGYLNNRQTTTCYIFGPYLSQPTACRTVNVDGFDSSNTFFRDFAQTHNQSSSYDGVTLFSNNTSSVTGLLTVFGFNQ